MDYWDYQMLANQWENKYHDLMKRLQTKNLDADVKTMLATRVGIAHDHFEVYAKMAQLHKAMRT